MAERHPAAAAASTRAAGTPLRAPGTFRVAILPTRRRRLRQLHVVVGTGPLTDTDGGALLAPTVTTPSSRTRRRHGGGAPPGSVAIGAHAPCLGALVASGRLVLLTVVESNWTSAPTSWIRSRLRAGLLRTTPAIATIEADNAAYWQEYWARASVCCRSSPSLSSSGMSRIL